MIGDAGHARNGASLSCVVCDVNASVATISSAVGDLIKIY